jgi:hypothetical protein
MSFLPRINVRGQLQQESKIPQQVRDDTMKNSVQVFHVL